MKGFNDYINQNSEGNYQYPQAGENAPEGVQASIKRFRHLPESHKRNQPLLYFLLGSGTPPYKMSQADASYRDRPFGNQKCANCHYAFHHLMSDTLICSQIRGEIKGEGWCRLWEGET